MTAVAIVVVAVVLVLAAAAALAWRARRRAGAQARGPRRRATIERLADATSIDRASGAVRSVQAADLVIGRSELAEIWTPMHLERLARTYWRFIARVTVGLIHVHYTPEGRSVVLLASPFRLLTFEAPEYEMDGTRGLVRWRIERGLLVARRGRDGAGYLQIEVSRSPHEHDAGSERLHVEVAVVNFYPAIASRLSLRLYDATQSRIHVIVTYGFLRSLARLDLAESRVGRFG
jgi:hypothetical protein